MRRTKQERVSRTLTGVVWLVTTQQCRLTDTVTNNTTWGERIVTKFPCLTHVSQHAWNPFWAFLLVYCLEKSRPVPSRPILSPWRPGSFVLLELLRGVSDAEVNYRCYEVSWEFGSWTWMKVYRDLELGNSSVSQHCLAFVWNDWRSTQKKTLKRT
jgi:hypothetical protein